MGLEQLAKMYKKGVESGNKRGFADTFKQAMKTFERTLKACMTNEWNKKDSIPITFEKVQYLDGYYIFGTGDNSVVHFHLKETPGWKYGIWWDIPKKYYDKESKKYVLPEYVEGRFFAQYEEDIDKFKPSASAICEEFTIVPNSKRDDSRLWYIAQHIKFIIKEPYLAFCRHHLFYNYNTEYVSRRKAKHKFFEWQKERKNSVKYTAYYNAKFLAYVKKVIADDIAADNMCVIDRGESWSPRYAIVAKQSAFPDLEIGSYDLFDSDDAEEVAQQKEWDKYLDKCRKQAEKHGAYIYTPIHDFFDVVEDKDWKSIKKSSI